MCIKVSVVTSGHMTKTAVKPFIRSAISKSPVLHANLMALMFYRGGVMADRGFKLHNRGNTHFRPFLRLP